VQPAELAQVLRRFTPNPGPGAEATEAPAPDVPHPPR
jgi:hypothetical protein